MLLESLKLTNFRVFKGEHQFSLAPIEKDGDLPPIVLFGGLNGSGKTTTLTAIRLTLYGRQSIGIGASQKAYDTFLTDSIHNSKTTGVSANNASVELTFSYANLGVVSHYIVNRSWTVINNKVTESLTISQDNTVMTNLSYEQAQGFLNELIPIGVSDLFFFDGEKISELAEDNNGNALGESVKKLIGLDLIDKLNADLTVFIRNQNKQTMSADIQKKTDILEKELLDKERQIETEQSAYEALRIKLAASSQKIDQLSNLLNSKGGAWAKTREIEIDKLSELTAERNAIEAQLKEIVCDDHPLSIAPDFVKHCLKQLDNEALLKQNRNLSVVLTKHIESLEEKLTHSIDQPTFSIIKKEIHNEFSNLLNPSDTHSVIHDMSDTIHKKITSVIFNSQNNSTPKVLELSNKLKSITNLIDNAGINIARAPDQELLNVNIQNLNNAQDEKATISIQANQQKESIKRSLREAMDIVRSLKNLHADFLYNDDNNRALDYAHKSKLALDEFAKRVTANKIQNVEHEFIKSFKKLARKDDINFTAKIEPNNFSVKLLDDFGNEVPKSNLSAGERQIYAIAILDALAKTSGRKLPIIIDTPLGRLDSKHRNKLVENYFPNASHQVIILSTDTEIDETYLSSLSQHISHTIMLNYSGKEASSNADKGYFWNTAEAI